MKVFLSYAQKDTELARKLSERLVTGGFQVWNPEAEINPGDNWAKKVGQALEDSDLMVILLTPKATESEWLRREIEFAIGSKKYDSRVFTVFVGPELEAGKDMPWILLKLPHFQVGSAKDFAQVVKQLRAMTSNSDLSHSNA
jgi:hypothetical protein